jgi:hypothetical protein
MNVAFFHIGREPLKRRLGRFARNFRYRTVGPRHLREENHLGLARLMMRSVRMHHPDARVVHLTDESTPALSGADLVVRDSETPREEVELAHTRLQRVFAESPLFDRATVFLDTDIIVNRPLVTVFDDNFDLALTWRDGFPLMPINYGVIFANPTDSAVRFLRAVEEDLSARELEHRRWFGGQYALKDLLRLKGDERGKRLPPYMVSDGVRIRLLPCEIYNYTPLRWPEDVADKYILHFKEFKAYMPAYYRQCVVQSKNVTKGACER